MTEPDYGQVWPMLQNFVYDVKDYIAWSIIVGLAIGLYCLIKHDIKQDKECQ